ncbi:hypothetical protein O181_034002 [Austropuccinia psidii MF-1]|uniref:Secreted protein n=1 Tax=Austropuccinia psidii MF-1 TaxID=1389203 RepID=A0A9Q3D2F4_9BASI|nr:hypothetical protein [Austropuccinia psidii MF-1]
MFSQQFFLKVLIVVAVWTIISLSKSSAEASKVDGVPCWMGFKPLQNGTTACDTGNNVFFCEGETCHMGGSHGNAHLNPVTQQLFFHNCHWLSSGKIIDKVLATYYRVQHSHSILILIGKDASNNHELGWKKVQCPRSANEDRPRCNGCEKTSLKTV